VCRTPFANAEELKHLVLSERHILAVVVERVHEDPMIVARVVLAAAATTIVIGLWLVAIVDTCTHQTWTSSSVVFALHLSVASVTLILAAWCVTCVVVAHRARRSHALMV